MDSFALPALLIYTFGGFAFGTMTVLWVLNYGEARLDWYSRDQAGACLGSAGCSRSAYLVSGALMALCFAWFLTNLALVLIPQEDRFWYLLTISLSLVMVFLFPPIIMHDVWAGSREHFPSGSPWRLPVVLAYVLGPVQSVILLLGFFGYLGISGRATSVLANIGIALMFTVAGIYSSLVMAKAKPPTETPEKRSSRRWTIALFAGIVLLSVIPVASVLGVMRFSRVAEIAMRSAPLAFLFVGTFFEHRFRFYDVFLKRGLALLLTIVVLALYFALVLPVLQQGQFGWIWPWVYSLTLLPLAIALPWLYGKLTRWLDNVWLGRQFSTVEAIQHFLSALQTATGQEHLISLAEEGIAAVFRAPVRIELSRPANPALPFPVQVEIPLRSSAGGKGMLRLGPRTNGLPYFSEDLTLLHALAEVFSHILENVRLQEKKQELSLQATRSDLKALRAQINPHFLFNALNAIAGLIHQDPARADRTVEHLAEVFRYTLRRSESEFARLEDEFDFVRAYLEVEQARFGRRLQFSVSLGPDVAQASVPTMVVQTLVENAIKHGVAQLRGEGRIEIDARRCDAALQITVADNGAGFNSHPGERPAASSAGEGYGLSNIRRRLAGYYGDRAQMEITRDQDHAMTVVSVVLPFSASEAQGLPAAALPLGSRH